MVERRRTKRLAIRSILIFASIFLAAIVYFLWITGRPFDGRHGVVFVGDTTVVCSIESERRRFTFLIIPAKTQIDAMRGYGWYDIQALQKLDDMDKRGGALLTASVEDAFATPIYSYISGIDVAALVDTSHSVQIPFSLIDGIGFFTKRQTNLSFVDMVRLWRLFTTMSPNTVSVFDFRTLPVTYAAPMPDGSTVWRLDKERYDAIIGSSLEDTPLRQEGIRVAITNTTHYPGIAQRFSRIVEHTGGFVVFVGNEEPVYKGMCEVSGKQEFLASKTAAFFLKRYGCTKKVAESLVRGDILVRLGDAFAQYYIPY